MRCLAAMQERRVWRRSSCRSQYGPYMRSARVCTCQSDSVGLCVVGLVGMVLSKTRSSVVRLPWQIRTSTWKRSARPSRQAPLLPPASTTGSTLCVALLSRPHAVRRHALTRGPVDVQFRVCTWWSRRNEIGGHLQARADCVQGPVSVCVHVHGG